MTEDTLSDFWPKNQPDYREESELDQLDSLSEETLKANGTKNR